jgi:predicted transcriptional regulator
MSGMSMAATESIGVLSDDDEKVSFASLSELTGFPVDFIKKELLLDEEPVSMNELRRSVLRYLEATSGEMAES